MLTDSPFAIRVMAFANIGAIDMVRMLEEAVTCNATVLVKLRDIEAPKEDDGFEGAFLSS